MSAIWELLKARLEYFNAPFPADAIALAHEHREELAPYLVAAIEQVAQRPEIATDDRGYMLHIFAMHLLACWRHTDAYRPLAQWANLPADVLDNMLGDVLHQSYGRCLASVCDGDLAPIRSIVENPSNGDYVRASAMTALTVRVLEEDVERSEMLSYLQKLAAKEIVRAQTQGLATEMDMLDIITTSACDLGMQELWPMIKDWFDLGLLDTRLHDRAWVRRTILTDFETLRAEQERRRLLYVTDVAREMSWIAGYQRPKGNTDYGTDSVPYPMEFPDTYVREAPKVGRNDPCPCGSGKKFKKCCGT
ncbi:MAG TPA: DUF1186 domain-containing protein [Rhodocyclaceae bacterium]|nr:DUF1186 domain-containing protein [Rhodocyclaceae bacterium]